MHTTIDLIGVWHSGHLVAVGEREEDENRNRFITGLGAVQGHGPTLLYKS